MTDPSEQICAHCGAGIPGDEVVWINPDTGDVVLGDLDDVAGEPYHEDCQP